MKDQPKAATPTREILRMPGTTLGTILEIVLEIASKRLLWIQSRLLAAHVFEELRDLSWAMQIQDRICAPMANHTPENLRQAPLELSLILYPRQFLGAYRLKRAQIKLGSLCHASSSNWNQVETDKDINVQVTPARPGISFGPNGPEAYHNHQLSDSELVIPSLHPVSMPPTTKAKARLQVVRPLARGGAAHRYRG